jgi:hypothetical protein
MGAGGKLTGQTSPALPATDSKQTFNTFIKAHTITPNRQSQTKPHYVEISRVYSAFANDPQQQARLSKNKSRRTNTSKEAPPKFHHHHPFLCLIPRHKSDPISMMIPNAHTIQTMPRTKGTQRMVNPRLGPRDEKKVKTNSPTNFQMLFPTSMGSVEGEYVQGSPSTRSFIFGKPPVANIKHPPTCFPPFAIRQKVNLITKEVFKMGKKQRAKVNVAPITQFFENGVK